MHELSLVEGILDMVRESAVQHKIKKINRINLVIGKFSMVMPDSLQFCFEALSRQEALFCGAILEIETREIVIYCRECQQEYNLDGETIFICPGCGKHDVEMISGREMYLAHYEGEGNGSCK